MREITVKGHAKINLGLDVTGLREDGYHLVRMIMQSVDVCDTITLTKKPEAGISLSLNVPGLAADSTNLAWRAAELLMQEFSVAEGIDIRLEKRIPMAAGLAGGSADAAAVLRGVNELFSLGLTKEELCARAVRLGADIPFCVMEGTMLSEGIGEILTELPPMPACTILLAKPGIDVPTGGVYRALDALSGYAHPDISGQIRALEAGDLDDLAAKMGNVLELVTVRDHPVIARIREIMMEQGAVGAMMSGSGPTVFGLFAQDEDAQRACSILETEGLASDLFLTVPYQNGGSVHGRR